jgi:hypothetical protein
MTPAWPRLLAAVVVAAGAAAAAAGGKADKSELQKDLRDQGIVGDWNYDDIDAAFQRAAREHRPVCVVFR